MNRILPLALCLMLGLASTAQAARVTVSDVRVRADDSFGILLATPNYAKAEAAIGQDKDGNWVIVYTVSRRPQLAEAPAISGLDGAIRESTAEDAVELGRDDRVDDAIAAAAAGRLRDKLAENGYVEAKVTYEIRHADVPGYAFLSFSVEPGNERDIHDYIFEGNTAFDNDTLAKAFGWMPIWNPLSWFTDFPRSDAKLDDARAAANAVYTDAGYLDAEISFPELRQRPDDDPGECDAIFKVNEGPRYTVGNIVVEGATLYPKEALEAAAKNALETSRDGKVATAATLAAVRAAVEDYYGSRGYVDTYANPVMVARADEPVVDITYHLSEGERVRIRDIQIRGNSITRLRQPSGQALRGPHPQPQLLPARERRHLLHHQDAQQGRARFGLRGA